MKVGEGDLISGSEVQVESVRRRLIPTVKWWHWALGLTLALCLVILAPRGKSLEFANLTEGSVSYSKIIAPFDFEILKSPADLKKERDAAVSQVLPVFIRDDSLSGIKRVQLKQLSSAALELLKSLDAAWLSAVLDTTRDWQTQEAQPFIDGTNRLFDRFGFRLSAEVWRALFGLYISDLRLQSDYFPKYFEFLDLTLVELYRNNIIKIEKGFASNSIDSLTVRQGSEEAAAPLDSVFSIESVLFHFEQNLATRLDTLALSVEAAAPTKEIIRLFLSPNLIYDEASTENRRQAALAQVPLAKGFVKRDELIIDSHIRITPEHLEKLNSLAQKRAEMSLERSGLTALSTYLGQILFALILVSVLWIFIALVRTPIWNEWKSMALLTAILLSWLIILIFLVVRLSMSVFLFPAAIGAMMIAILVDRGVALGAVVMAALAAGFLYSNDYQLVFLTLIIGGTSILALRRIERRGDVMRGAIYISAAYLLLAFTFHLSTGSAGAATLLNNIGFGIINATLTPILVLGFVPLCENLFRVSTELTLLELVDLNQPLLRELALKSPGTYHHSLMVGNLAEAAARAVGANFLLTRAGAYYHDIGKIGFKEYFIENQSTGSENVHDRLPPSRSAEIIISHISHGLALADKYKLPSSIKAFIREHHGKTRLAYFYAKAQRELGSSVREEAFRYLGPKPQMIETGLVMLADVVEAATRSLEQPTPEELKETVQRLMRTRLTEGDLDECPLTLRELSAVEKAFMQVLFGIYHQRIRYLDEESRVQTESLPLPVDGAGV